jgi:hypothetical protein
LNDLVFIEELPDREGERGEYVNWEKMSMLAKVFSLILKFQKLPYTFEEIPALNAFLSDLPNQSTCSSSLFLSLHNTTAQFISSPYTSYTYILYIHNERLKTIHIILITLFLV